MGLKDDYMITLIEKKHAKDLVKRYHYLGEKDFLSVFSFGLIDKSSYELLGCAVFAHPNGNVTLKGWFGVDNDSDIGLSIYELTRLVVHPSLNGKNVSSFLLSNAIKELRKITDVKAIITLADSSRHLGYVYQACNFKYYGLTTNKKDFYMYDENSINGYKLNPRGKVTDKDGVWLNRSEKHRYALIFDKKLKVKYKEEKYPKGCIKKLNCCEGCEGKGYIIDTRFFKKYTCPICVGVLKYIGDCKNHSSTLSLVNESNKKSNKSNKFFVSNLDNF